MTKPKQSSAKVLSIVFAVGFALLALVVLYAAVTRSTEQRSKAAGEHGVDCLATYLSPHACNDDSGGKCRWFRCGDHAPSGCLSKRMREDAACDQLRNPVTPTQASEPMPTATPTPIQNQTDCSSYTSSHACGDGTGGRCRWYTCSDAVRGCRSRSMGEDAACADIQHPTPQNVAGDINGDGHITVVDYTLFLNDFGKTSGFNPKSDLNGDGKVDLSDFVGFMELWRNAQ